VLPVIPFEILIPVTIFAALLVAVAVGFIFARRASVRWWTKNGERLTRQAQQLVVDAKNGDRSPEAVAHWIGRNRPVRIDSLVTAVLRVEETDGELKGWLDSSPVTERLGEIAASGAETNGNQRRRARWARVAAAQALGRLRLHEGLDALRIALDDPDLEVGYAAADALARLNIPAAGAAILDQIQVEQRLNNSRLASYVEPMTCDLTEVFRDQLQRTDAQALFWTVTLIGHAEIFDLVVEIRPLLDSEDANVRAATCEAIGELKIPLTDRWLAPLLADEMWFVASHAARALGELRAAWAIDELVKLVYDNEWWVRQNAADALIKIGPQASEAVERVLWSEDRFARNTAVEILERIDWINSTVDRAARDDSRAKEALRQFGVSGGVGYLENALFTVSEEGVPELLALVRELGDDASYGRIRAAAEQMPERLQPLAYSVAAEMRGR
jgi:HEAT repeat protein